MQLYGEKSADNDRGQLAFYAILLLGGHRFFLACDRETNITGKRTVKIPKRNQTMLYLMEAYAEPICGFIPQRSCG
jgi:hypothetical protein